MEQSYPEWAFNASWQWEIEDVTVSWFSISQSKQTLASTPIEDIDQYDLAFLDEFWSYNASVRWAVKEGYSVTVGVNNLTDEQPCFGNVATPVSSVGRFFFLRVAGSY